MRDIILMFVTVLIGVGGQLLLKKGVISVNGISFSEGILGSLLKIISSPFLLGGFTFYALSAILTLMVLSRVELGTFALFTSLSYVIVLFASALLFAEALTVIKLVGAALIISGIYVIVR
jgi:drug/metabolite transporter (DMT)-like permease